MREMTDEDLARLRRAVQRRDQCVTQAVAYAQRLDIPLTTVQARVAYDAMADMIRTEAS